MLTINLLSYNQKLLFIKILLHSKKSVNDFFISDVFAFKEVYALVLVLFTVSEFSINHIIWVSVRIALEKKLAFKDGHALRFGPIN